MGEKRNCAGYDMYDDMVREPTSTKDTHMKLTDEMRQAVAAEQVQWASQNLSWENASRFIGAMAMIMAQITETPLTSTPEGE
jgi:hypothetical protein